jgi:4-amino-4-deoxy-L-arabinose transferase-like glycosyltransferase
MSGSPPPPDASRPAAPEPASGARAQRVILVAAALLFLTGLGGVGLWAPDEPRYAQVAEEARSLAHGWRGLVVLHLNGKAYDQKPPLYYWTAAALGAPLGRVTEAAARLPSALCGIACVALLLRFGRALVPPRTALLAGALLLTSQEFAHLARRVQLDVMLTAFTTLAMWAIWRVDRGAGSRRRDAVLLHASLGLAALTKGPVGWLPLLVAAVYLAWEGRLRDFRRLVPWWAPLLSVGPLLAWFAGTVALGPKGWVGGALVQNLYGRFVHGTSHGRPLYYFLYNFPILFLPWALAWPLVVRPVWEALRAEADPERRRVVRFLVSWIATLFVFFSLSSGKRSLYLLPAAPAAALLTADALLRALDARPALPRWLAAAGAVLVGAGLLGGIAIAAAGPSLPHPLPRLYGVALAAGAGLAALAWRRAGDTRAPRPWVAGLGGPMTARLAVVLLTVWLLELASFTLLFPALDEEKSPRSIALAAAELAGPDERIGLVGERGLIGGVAYYARRRVATLESGEDVRRFLERGGRVLIAREKELERVTSVTPVEVRARARSGRRALVVVVPPTTRDGAPPAGTGEPAPGAAGDASPSSSAKVAPFHTS